MRWERVFLANGRVRPIWRFFLSAILIFLALVAVNLALAFIFGLARKPPEVLTSLALASLLLCPTLLGIFEVLTGAFEHKPLGSAGLAFCGRWKTELGIGLAVGAAMILVVGGLERLLGVGEFSWSPSPPGRVLVSGLFMFLVIFVAATNEELMFRGYAFQRLVEAAGPAGAVALSSALFGLLHLGNPFHTWTSTLNTMLVGIPLAVAYLRTRLLWMPIGIHFAWNFVQGFGLGLPVSGLPPPFSVCKAQVSANDLLTGGNYGPEGGLLATGVILAVTVYLFLSKSIYISEETRKLVFAPASIAGSSAGAVISLRTPGEQADGDRRGAN